MLSGVEAKNYEIILDRKQAIRKGISLLKEYDTLLILGKGHEEYMIIKDKKIPFKDSSAVEEILNENMEIGEIMNGILVIDKPKNCIKVGIIGELYTSMEENANYFIEKELSNMNIEVTRYTNVTIFTCYKKI